jgi:hypothetical protein
VALRGEANSKLLKHGNWRMLQSKHSDASKPVQLELSFAFTCQNEASNYLQNDESAKKITKLADFAV